MQITAKECFEVITAIETRRTNENTNLEQIGKKPTKSADTALSNFRKIYAKDVNAFIKGYKKILSLSGLKHSDVTKRITVMDSKAQDEDGKHIYMNLKGMNKFYGLIAFFGGYNVGIENFIQCTFSEIVKKSNIGYLGINPNGVLGSEFTSLNMRESMSYKSAETPERMDELINLEYPDYNPLTASTQTSQFKTILISLRLIDDIKYQVNATIKCAPKFARAVHANKDNIVVKNSNRQG